VSFRNRLLESIKSTGGHTWTYSITLLSPISRVAVTLVAGKAFGTTFRRIRFRELVTVKEDIDTAQMIRSACIKIY
jgi:hypothetical protein